MSTNVLNEHIAEFPVDEHDEKLVENTHPPDWKNPIPAEYLESSETNRGPSVILRKATVKIADFIRANSDPSERIAVIGSEPQIYFYSRRLAATGLGTGQEAGGRERNTFVTSLLGQLQPLSPVPPIIIIMLS